VIELMKKGSDCAGMRRRIQEELLRKVELLGEEQETRG